MAQSERVLLVEADGISSQLLSFSLQREGFEVIQAQNGVDGLRLASTTGADVILSEALLPDIDGYEMCRQLRAGWSTQRMPILLLTSLGSTESRVGGLLAGADDFLTKPYDLRELVIRLRRLISTYSNCSHLHPVTKLPGSQIIRSYVEEICLTNPNRDWALLQIDLNRFKVYNQVYGFKAGDEVLQLVGNLLREIVCGDVTQECEGKGGPCFIGHESGDDFIAIVPTSRADDTCKRLMAEFDGRVLSCYPSEDRSSQYHVLIDRAGNTRLVPYLSLAIGVVTGDLCGSMSYLDIREVAATVTRKAKAEEKSNTCVNRRHAAGRRVAITKHKVRL